MTLSIRPKAYSLPSYSLTGDLLGFLRCGLQYRYSSIGNLPPSHPVQMWFGQFIHGVMDEGYRYYKDTQKLPPWTEDEVARICSNVKTRLAAQGLFAWDKKLEKLGHERATVGLQELGPNLFPLINRSEVKLTGSRLLPPISSQLQFRVADRYEMLGIVDVVTRVEITSPQFKQNPVVQAVMAALPQLPRHDFEIIFDYKGMRRPSCANQLSEHYAWQVQTYAELRRKQSGALPVIAGVLIYINELHPSSSDMEKLKKEIKNCATDVMPEKGSADEQAILNWGTTRSSKAISFAYRLKRALRIIPVDDASIQRALTEFDQVVQRIETCRGEEIRGMSIIKAWEKNTSEEDTCVVCDSRTYCPAFQKKYAKKTGETCPRLPFRAES